MKNLSASFIATAVIQLVTVVGGVLSARLLLPQGKGELTAIMLWPSLLASIGNLGIIEAVAYLTASNAKHSAKALASGIVLVLGLATGLVGLGYLILPLVLSEYGADVVNTARLYLVYIPINFMALSLMAVILGRLRIVEYNVLRTLVHMGFVAGMVFLYAINRVSVEGFAIASLVANFITLAIAVGIVLRHQWLSWQPDVQIIKKLLDYGLKVHLGSVALLINLRFDQMLMSIFLSPTTLGLYVVAVTVSGGASLAANTVGLVAFPHMANLGSPQAKKLTLGRFMRLAIFLSLVSAAGLFWLTPWILSFFFGPAYLPAIWAARILLLASIPLGCNIVFAAGFKAFDHPLVPSKAELVSLGVTGVSLWVLLPRYAALGAAWASLLAYSASCAFMVYALWRELGMNPAVLFRPTLEDWEYVTRQLTRFSTQMGAFRRAN